MSDFFLEKKIAGLQSENKRLRQALQDIVNPVAALRRHAEAEGAQLNGMAYAIANDPNYLQGIARAALTPHKGTT